MDKVALKLQERLVQTCIDFINEYKDDEQVKEIQMVDFTADNLQESVKYNAWSSCTDSYCGLTGTKPVMIGNDAGTGNDIILYESYFIDESY